MISFRRKHAQVHLIQIHKTRSIDACCDGVQVVGCYGIQVHIIKYCTYRVYCKNEKITYKFLVKYNIIFDFMYDNTHILTSSKNNIILHECIRCAWERHWPKKIIRIKLRLCFYDFPILSKMVLLCHGPML